MESNTTKLKRYRVKKFKVRKIKVKEPGVLTRKLSKIFGPVYLESHRQINIGICLLISILLGLFLLLAMGSPVFNRVAPVIINQKQGL